MFLLLRMTVLLNSGGRERQENRIREIAIILSVGDPEPSDNSG
jgi:hypothetical protein